MATVERAPEEELVGRVQRLTAEAEALPDPHAREVADDLAAAVVQLYGEGLERIFAALEPGDPRAAGRGRGRGEPHAHPRPYPVPLEDACRRRSRSVRPYMESHGGDVELLGHPGRHRAAAAGGLCSGCAASQSTLELAIERALEETAPDLLGIDVEGVVARPAERGRRARREWVEPTAWPGSSAGRWRGGPVAAAARRHRRRRPAARLLVANVAGTLLAYRDRCAGCDAPLSRGRAARRDADLRACARRFDLPRAGRCLDDEGLQLEPVPLLRNGGPVRVALGR